VKPLLIIILLTPLVLAATNSTDPFAKIGQTIDQILTSLDNFLQNLKEALKTHITSISKTLSVILGLVGALLYFSGINKYGGRSMIIGAVLLYLFAEFITTL
jgi:hypothetical protein